MAKYIKSGRGPKLACEISARYVIAGRVNDGGEMLEQCSVRALPAGAVTPSLTGVNIADNNAVVRAVGDALATVDGRGRDITLVVPDAAVRVSLLDFDRLPERPQEADAVVRFRLKKALPFDLDRAAVSYHLQRGGEPLRVVAAVGLNSVLAEYEAVARDAGYNPGVLLPSTLASLGVVDATHATLVVKADTATTSVAIVDHNQLLLFRTMETSPGSEPSAELVAEEVYPSLVFFQDTYGSRAERIMAGGFAKVAELAAALQQDTGVRVQELLGPSVLGPGIQGGIQRWLLAGVAGALISG